MADKPIIGHDDFSGPIYAPIEPAPEEQPDRDMLRDRREIRRLIEALEAHKIMLSEGALREGNLLNALHMIADLDKHGGYNCACDWARKAIQANRDVPDHG